MSISNVDLTDTEQNSLDEAFGKMHEKVNSFFLHTFVSKIKYTVFFPKNHISICYKIRCTASATATSLSTATTTITHITTRSNKVLSMNEIGPKKIETIFFQDTSEVPRDPTSHNRAYITLAKVCSHHLV